MRGWGLVLPEEQELGEICSEFLQAVLHFDRDIVLGLLFPCAQLGCSVPTQKD